MRKRGLPKSPVRGKPHAGICAGGASASLPRLAVRALTQLTGSPNQRRSLLPEGGWPSHHDLKGRLSRTEDL